MPQQHQHLPQTRLIAQLLVKIKDKNKLIVSPINYAQPNLSKNIVIQSLIHHCWKYENVVQLKMLDCQSFQH